MNEIQALFDGLSQQWQKERAESQMTLGDLLDRLQQLPDNTTVHLGDPHSYRGYYQDLAFQMGEGKSVSELLEICRSCMGEVFEGYKGGEFQMGRLTPVWVAFSGEIGESLIGISDDGDIETVEEENYD